MQKQKVTSLKFCLDSTINSVSSLIGNQSTIKGSFVKGARRLIKEVEPPTSEQQKDLKQC